MDEIELYVWQLDVGSFLTVTQFVRFPFHKEMKLWHLGLKLKGMEIALKYKFSVICSRGNNEEVCQVDRLSRKSLLFASPFQLLNNQFDHFSSGSHLSDVQLWGRGGVMYSYGEGEE